jgi:hypothetical protein
MAGLVAALTACGADATRPTALTGSFDLVSVDEMPLPFTFPAGLTGQQLLSARIEFHSRSRLFDIREYMSRDPDGTVVSETDTAAYAYRISADTLLVLHPAFDAASAYSDTGSVVDASIALQILQRRSTASGGDVFYRFLYQRSP